MGSSRMAVDIGIFRVLVSTLHTDLKYRGYWHISMILPDGSSKAFEDRPIAETFATEDEARTAALEAGTARARELNERNRIEPYRDDD
jgi:hypothetical protein